LKFQLCIIVPIFNEEANIWRVRDELVKYFKKAKVPTKALLVNDGSTDRSLDYIKQVCKDHEALDYISFKTNCGLSAAIKAGFDYTTTPLVGYIDADLQTTPEDFNLLLTEMGDYDLITGLRAERKDSGIKNLSSIIANKIRRSFTNDGMDDTGCPLKIIKTDVAQSIPFFSGLHRFLPAMVLLQNGRIKQVPVRHFERMAGDAKFGLRNRLIGPLIDCFVYSWMKKRYIKYQVNDKSL
jgi:glycosyltransferase involved in cell wall biosynthesis